MLRDIRVAASAILVSALAASSSQAGERTSLAIDVFDHARGSAVLITEPQHHVARLYGLVGINVVWRERSIESLSGAAKAGQLSVVILSDTMAAQKAAKEGIPAGVLGTAAPAPARRVWIFLSRIEEFAARQGLSAGLVLGHVIAHEVAHTAANIEHSNAGLMAARLQPSPDTLQAFTDQQGRQLREAIRAAENSRTILEARNRPRPVSR